MAYKIYTKSNYFYIVDTENDKIFEGLAKEVRVRKEFVDSTSFIFENVNGLSTSLQIPFASIQDESGVAYADVATFVAFYEANTGNFNSGGATPQYSETEQVIGSFKGKPLYAKVFNFSVVEPDISITIVHNLNIERYLRHSVLLKSSYYGNDASNFSQVSVAQASLFSLNINEIYIEASGLEHYDTLIIEYTKI